MRDTKYVNSCWFVHKTSLALCSSPHLQGFVSRLSYHFPSLYKPPWVTHGCVTIIWRTFYLHRYCCYRWKGNSSNGKLFMLCVQFVSVLSIAMCSCQAVNYPCYIGYETASPRLGVKPNWAVSHRTLSPYPSCEVIIGRHLQKGDSGGRRPQQRSGPPGGAWSKHYLALITSTSCQLVTRCSSLPHSHVTVTSTGRPDCLWVTSHLRHHV